MVVIYLSHGFSLVQVDPGPHSCHSRSNCRDFDQRESFPRNSVFFVMTLGSCLAFWPKRKFQAHLAHFSPQTWWLLMDIDVRG